MTALHQSSKLGNFGLCLEMKAGASSHDLSRKELLALLREHKLVLVRGLNPMDREDLLRFAARSVEQDLLHWKFGPVMEMRVDPRAENYLFSREAVPMHWDGAFYLEPRVLVFHCVEAPSHSGGGETLFTDTEAVWENASREQKKKWNKIWLTYETEKVAHYGGRISNPMVQYHPDKPTTVLRFAEPVSSTLNPVHCEVEGLTGEKEAFFEEMRALLYSPDFLYEHRWETNDLLLADNFSLIHGRRAFSQESPRHLRRVQLR